MKVAFLAWMLVAALSLADGERLLHAAMSEQQQHLAMASLSHNPAGTLTETACLPDLQLASFTRQTKLEASVLRLPLPALLQHQQEAPLSVKPRHPPRPSATA